MWSMLRKDAETKEEGASQGNGTGWELNSSITYSDVHMLAIFNRCSWFPSIKQVRTICAILP